MSLAGNRTFLTRALCHTSTDPQIVSCSVAGRLSKRHTPSLTRLVHSKAPWLHPVSRASWLLWASPTPSCSRLSGYLFPNALRLYHRTAVGLPGSSMHLSVRALPYHPGVPCAHTRFFPAGDRLRHLWQLGHTQSVYRGRIGFACARAHTVAVQGVRPVCIHILL